MTADSNQTATTATNVNPTISKTTGKPSRDAAAAIRVVLILLGLLLLSSFFVIVDAGQRGVLLQFGQVQSRVLSEGIHFVIPLANTVHKLSVRIQSQEISAEASSRDLQDVYADVALNWHIIPTEAHLIFQQIGDGQAVIDRIINPAVEEVLKAVMAQYTAEELITRRGEVKAEVDRALLTRLANYHIAVDDISLVHVHFSARFSEAVEAKQIAEQEAKRAEFIAIKALQEAEAQVNLARGEAQAQQLLRESLTPAMIQRQAIAKWNGNLPLIVGSDAVRITELNQLLKTNQKVNQKSK